MNTTETITVSTGVAVDPKDLPETTLQKMLRKEAKRRGPVEEAPSADEDETQAESEE